MAVGLNIKLRRRMQRNKQGCDIQQVNDHEPAFLQLEGLTQTNCIFIIYIKINEHSAVTTILSSQMQCVNFKLLIII